MGRANGCAVVIAPGGGFRTVNFPPEGKDPADYLNSLGVTCFVLKYRLPNDSDSPYELEHVRQDAFRAMRVVRSRAPQLGIDPHRIGMLGFSAGTTVITLVSLDNGSGDPDALDPIDRVDARPDFQMLIYPSGENLLPKATPSNTPPAFLVCADDDEYGCETVMLHLLKRLQEANISVEAHFIAQGKHAFNMGGRSEYAAIRNWPGNMRDWLNDRGFLAAPRTVAAVNNN
jgi:acetyl esterase/lipase